MAANFDSDGDGGDVVSIEGEARLARAKTMAADVPPASVDSYAAQLPAAGLAGHVGAAEVGPDPVVHGDGEPPAPGQYSPDVATALSAPARFEGLPAAHEAVRS